MGEIFGNVGGWVVGVGSALGTGIPLILWATGLLKTKKEIEEAFVAVRIALNSIKDRMPEVMDSKEVRTAFREVDEAFEKIATDLERCPWKGARQYAQRLRDAIRPEHYRDIKSTIKDRFPLLSTKI